MALAGVVIVTMVIGHTHLMTHLVTVMDRRMVVVGVGGQRCHERSAHHEQCNDSRAMAGNASGGLDDHAGLLCGEDNVAVPGRRVNTVGKNSLHCIQLCSCEAKERKLLRLLEACLCGFSCERPSPPKRLLQERAHACYDVGA
jgi:hypothetical protein